ncbi:Os09g0429100 [Oryza sativa Japonica Group]|uniref:Os09g0429100 protein n=2 Tax=Oryza TaxID=4527 RepID=Q69L10_ORYSJ|nr:hypothetical protein [Oryza sativa Japonica Group]BAH94580.1 Os09g0429100 [Oryza sativa Japonica Group]|eukprot:NP_001175852.1 Os09g0429100 [Oryza sativa Japonica Group]
MTATPGRLPRPQGSSSAVPRPRGLPGVSVLLLPDKAMDAGEDMPPVAEEPTLRRSDKMAQLGSVSDAHLMVQLRGDLSPALRSFPWRTDFDLCP